MAVDRPTNARLQNLAGVVSVEPVVLYINEFMADNDTIVEDPDEAGAFEDWIELYNPGTEPVDLSGMYMTDDLTDPVQWQFAAGMTIAAGGYLVVWADSDTEQGDAHASFKLSADGETIALYHIDGATLIDSIAFGVQTTDVSYGRYPDGSENWISMTTSTPGAANDLAPTNVAPTAEAAGPYSGTVGDTITLSGAASTDTDGAIADYAWDLDNDGQYDDATGATAQFQATTAGTFTIGLQVTDDDDATDTDTATIIVTELDVPKPGDANRDGVFNSSDLIQVLQAGEYEDGVSNNSDWEEGDWNGDGDFTSFDLVIAFQTGLYEVQPSRNASEIAAAVDWLFAQDMHASRPCAYVA